MTARPKRWVILPAGGTGTRLGLPYPKQLLPWRGRPLLLHVLELFAGEDITVPVPASHREVFAELLAGRVRLLDGGETRYDSVRRAFEAIAPAPDDLVLIHDVARPFLNATSLPAAWARAEQCGALIYAQGATDTIKQVDQQGCIVQTHDRTYIYQAQTPQLFRAGLLADAYALHDRLGGPAPTDEAALLEMSGVSVYIWQSGPGNRKLTHKEDLGLLDADQMRIGHGYDVHRFDPERPLFLGGCEIVGGPGLLGHSDADVVIHALIDALLGAAGLGDIGTQFPDSAAEFKNIRSTVLLERVWRPLREAGWRLCNADITIEAQVPKLAPHIPAMRETLRALLDGAPVNLKATTTEGLGFVGRKEGMAAHAVVLMRQEVRS